MRGAKAVALAAPAATAALRPLPLWGESSNHAAADLVPPDPTPSKSGGGGGGGGGGSQLGAEAAASSGGVTAAGEPAPGTARCEHAAGEDM